MTKTTTKIKIMKKTLIALLALGSLAMAAEEAITLSSPDWDDKSGYTSFDFVLNSTWLTKTPETAVLTESVNLTSITVDAAATWYNQKTEHRTQGAGVAIYEKSGNVWNFVGSSDWVTGYGANQTTAASVTFNVTDLTLSSSTKYTAVFYGNKEAFDGLTSKSTLYSLMGAGNSPSLASPIVAFGMKATYTQDVNFALYGNTGGTTVLSPYVTFGVQNLNVPEPTTGTLSLLALAGLCARRRRK